MRTMYPKMLVDSPLGIEISFLATHKIDTVFIDVDNTLLAPRERLSSEELKLWINRVKAQGIRVFLVSNNTSKRISDLSRDLDVEGLPRAYKPFVFRIKRFIRKHQVDVSTCCFIGDQLFTDMWAAYRLGMMGIMVNQISPKDYFYTRWIRKIEQWVLRQGGLR